MKTRLALFTALVVISSLGPVQPLDALGHQGVVLTDTSSVTQFRMPGLSCLGLPDLGLPDDIDYVEAFQWDGWANITLDGRGRLHLAAKGTYAWAIFSYATEISGPFDTDHDRLYFGSTEVDFREIVDPYTAGTQWTYFVPSVVVSDADGAVVETLVPASGDPGSILTISFDQNEVGPLRHTGYSGSLPVCE